MYRDIAVKGLITISPIQTVMVIEVMSEEGFLSVVDLVLTGTMPIASHATPDFTMFWLHQ